MKKNNISKCNKDCCLHCGTNYCRFVEQLQQLKQENEELKDKFNINEQECWDIAFLKHDLAKTEQKLEKIKEIVSSNNYNGLNISHYYVKNVKKLILQIIEEE